MLQFAIVVIGLDELDIDLSLLSIRSSCDHDFLDTLLIVCVSPCVIQTNKYDFSSELVWLEDSRSGIYAAFNLAISYILCLNITHIAFLNSGDQMLRGFRQSISLCRSNPESIVSGVADIRSLQNIHIKYFSGGKSHWNIIHPLSIYPITCFRHCLYNERLMVSSDWHLNYKLRGYHFLRHTTPVVIFYLGGISSSGRSSVLIFKDELTVLLTMPWNYLNPQDYHYVLRLISSSLGLIRYFAAQIFFVLGRLLSAILLRIHS
ncbi:MAG: hypothetical protein FJY21_12435 [Bacteroidetes bacterium]|nr:hypothetical protein [Bacteroidota bacterium]